MPFLPRMKFQIVSRKTPGEVQALLQSVTDSERKWFRFTYPDKAFVGRVGETDFRIMPVPGDIVVLGIKMHVKNSFLPVIVGRIRAEGSGTVLDIRMRLLGFVFGFMVVWFSVPVLVFLISLLALITGDPDGWMVVPMAAFILVGQIMVRCAFYYPAKKARYGLEKLLGEASEVDWDILE